MAEAAPSAGNTLMSLFVQDLIRRMTEDKDARTPAVLEVVRKFLGDNSITLASVQRGDFGDFARQVAEEYPFQDDGDPHPLNS